MRGSLRGSDGAVFAALVLLAIASAQTASGARKSIVSEAAKLVP
jgi:hypothetical protein